MRVLFVASECVPFAKTGGLADVIGALPKALKKLGTDVRVMLPCYADIPESFKSRMETVVTFTVQLGWRSQYCGVRQLDEEGIRYYFLDNEYYFGRSGLYGYGDEAERFAFFSRAVLEALPHLKYAPDIIHCHDWQSALIPPLLSAHFRHLTTYHAIKTIMTIHNLKYQGIFDKEALKDLLSLDDSYFQWNTMELHGGGSLLKGGIAFADLVTTVSPSYAEEIRMPFYGEHLNGLLDYRKEDLFGIVNGIDTELYNPETDPHIAYRYKDLLEEKRLNKSHLQEELGLSVNDSAPLIGIVSRLVEQKGFDLIEAVLDDIMRLDVQMAVLGSGDAKYEGLFEDAHRRYPDRISVYLGFNDPLARRIYAGSDLFLMPSQFEPCGIGQLLALRYLSVPIVRETGGLRDTVQPYNVFTGEGTGFSFAHYNAHDMLYTIERAVDYYARGDVWPQLAANIARRDFSWSRSAEQYLELYRRLEPR